MSRQKILLASLLALSMAAAFLPAASAGEAGRYIVVLKDSVSKPGSVASDHAKKHGAQVGFVYTRALKGYSAAIPAARLKAVADDPRVAYLESDHTMAVTAQTLP
ncbi:MAG: protease inhibitor I9 family protein, partial [Actinomycetota bacterium]